MSDRPSWLNSCLNALRILQWKRGLRAGIAVSVAMIVCHLLDRPMGWAALGGFETILVDNGGPYRSRLHTISTLLVAGFAGCVLGATATPLWLACIAAGAFCFGITFARVLAQPIDSTAVIIMVLYFAGVGSAEHTLAGAAVNGLAFVLGGVWAAALSLILWPVDPFRPARRAVAECYQQLANFTASLHPATDRSDREAVRLRAHTFQGTVRLKIEAARRALGATSARSPSRTVRARNLTVLLETADMLFAETLRWTELVEQGSELGIDEATRDAIAEALRWLSRAEMAIYTALEQRPADGAASFAPEGSHSLEHIRGRAATATQAQSSPDLLLAHLGQGERSVLENLEIAFEAVYAVWSGTEVRSTRTLLTATAPAATTSVLEALRSNWTFHSLMMRHALRVSVVAIADVLLMRTLMQRLHVSHGAWLAMTSLIVLQPFGSGTLRKGVQRVGGTIAGGILAALLAASIRSETGIIAVITLTSIMTLATYAVDYAWYSFFLTPTFVLLSLPHLRDWRYAGIRIGATILGAIVAVLAMRLLWPEREQRRLGRLLSKAAAADAAYLRAMIQLWQHTGSKEQIADQARLAAARRTVGLTILSAEETLDRMMLDPGFALTRRNSTGEGRSEALTLLTYLRRLARSAIMLTPIAVAPEEAIPRMEHLALRLDALCMALSGDFSAPIESPGIRPSAPPDPHPIAEQQMRRLERQVGVLERAAAAIVASL
ncbi:MAG TPA: FUSC family protein [Granulicella sp.]